MGAKIFMKPLILIAGLLLAGATLMAQAPAAAPAPGAVMLPPSSAQAPVAPGLPTVADPAYMQAATQALKSTQADPEVQAAEQRLQQVRTQNALRLEEAELNLELVRLLKGAAADGKPAPIVEQRKTEISARLAALAALRQNENAPAPAPENKEKAR